MTEFKKTKANILTCAMCDFADYCVSERNIKKEHERILKNCRRARTYYYKSRVLQLLKKRRF